MKKVLFLTLSLLLTVGLSAKVTLPNVLGSNMVLQQQCNANLWGKASPSKKVTVSTSWNNQKYSVSAAADSTWKIAVETPVAGGPYSISISDGETIELRNVMIGEVWICSGQSNMQMPVAGLGGQPTDNANQTILNANNYPDIRLLTVKRETSPEPLNNCNTENGWREGSPESVSEFSAAGYFFGLNLHNTLKVPIGLIEADWGGTRIEAWMTISSAQKTEPDVLEKDVNHIGPNKAACLFNAMIHPLINYTACGFIWYQGESNIHTGNLHLYARHMEQMITLWRDQWGNPNMPFYYVQIAPFCYEGVDGISVPLIVEQQVQVLDKVPYTGMASTTDIGNAACIHPPQKYIVGQRLALLALNKTYGIKGVSAQSPRYKSVRFEKDKAIVTLHSDVTLGPDYRGPIAGFEVAGADKVFVPAQAAFLPNSQEIVVSSAQVTELVAVRYAFRNVPQSTTLTNIAGLPAFPFRTDSW